MYPLGIQLCLFWLQITFSRMNADGKVGMAVWINCWGVGV